MSNNRLDIIVFGATGYAGKYAVKETARVCKEQNMKFGIAGRRKEALETIIKELKIDIGKIKFVLIFSIREFHFIFTILRLFYSILVNCFV